MDNDGRFDAVVSDLSGKLSMLKAGQFFYIVLFDTDARPMPAKHLLPATPQNVRAMIQWLKTQMPSGSTDPTAAMQLAFSLNPQTIWLLSDGDFDSNISVNLENAARRHRVPINTIAFHSPGNATLRPISTASGGFYLYVPAPSGSMPSRLLPGPPRFPLPPRP